MSASIHNCPACNFQIEDAPEQKVFFCPNCGKPITPPNAQSDGISPEKTLDKACVFMNQGQFDAALPLIDEVLTLSPEYADAYIVKLLCKLHLTKINDLGNISTPLSSFEEFRKALRYASVTQMNRYEKLLESNAKNIDQQLAAVQCIKAMELKKEITVLQERIGKAKEFLSKHPVPPPLPKWRKILRIIEQIFMTCAVIFWTTGALVGPVLLVIDAPFLLRLIFIIIRNQKAKRLPQKIQSVSLALSQDQTLLEEKTELLALLAK